MGSGAVNGLKMDENVKPRFQANSNPPFRVRGPVYGENSCLGRNFKCIIYGLIILSSISLAAIIIVYLVKQYM
ncbi:hypothetical protein evm_014433 [Chilo suppressalis]|nr:hypothetical protein evm_014433 [Chilo suppressalis]